MLAWALRYGEHEKFLERLAQQKGVHGADDAAEKLRQRPQLHKDLEDVWRAWHYLNTTRTGGMGGVDAIPIPAMAAWLDVHGVPRHRRPWWVRLWLHMEAAFLKHARRKPDGDSGNDPGRERGPARGA